jgi:hypothetical protein
MPDLELWNVTGERTGPICYNDYLIQFLYLIPRPRIVQLCCHSLLSSLHGSKSIEHKNKLTFTCYSASNCIKYILKNKSSSVRIQISGNIIISLSTKYESQIQFP